MLSKNKFGFEFYTLVLVGSVYLALASGCFPASLPKVEKVKISLTDEGVKIEQDILKIYCRYDEIIKLDTISSLPEINYRSWGIGMDTLLAGHFNMKGIEDAMLFVNPEHYPFIYIKAKGNKNIFINLDHLQKTINLYNKLKAELK